MFVINVPDKLFAVVFSFQPNRLLSVVKRGGTEESPRLSFRPDAAHSFESFVSFVAIINISKQNVWSL